MQDFVHQQYDILMEMVVNNLYTPKNDNGFL